MMPSYWPQAKAHLSKNDPALKKIIGNYKGEGLTLRGNAFYTLARSIAGQQISVKAADSVWRRMEMAVAIEPEAVANTGHDMLRACGLSTGKVIYMHALANHFLENKPLIKQWPQMTDEEIIKELTSVKGIGRWTAEMFLIFHLGRPDVFPVADLGLQKAMKLAYPKKRLLKPDSYRKLAAHWQPYRSAATWYLWRSLDPVAVAY